ncbi:MAG TPA: hypothetical protein VKR06_02655 [Ktedonosporobacter sp.]|nr:hypothetical protein [Ktedonosporobacter sp.]
MDWITAAILTPLACILYLIVMDWINLYPWNNVAVASPRQKLWLSILTYTPLIYVSLAFKLHNPSLMIAALVIVIFYILWHIASWWLPYFFGTSESRKLEHERLFGKTVTILPRIKDHPTPTVGHMVVGLYLAVMLIVSTNAIMRS